MNSYLRINPEVKEALETGKPVVALESTLFHTVLIILKISKQLVNVNVLFVKRGCSCDHRYCER